MATCPADSRTPAPRRRRWLPFLLGGWFAAGLTATQGWAAEEPSVEEMARIEEACPKAATVNPAQNRKVLIYCRAWGYVHSSIPYGASAFAMMGDKTGAYESVVTYEEDWFEPDRLGEFDAVILNNTNNEIFMPEKPGELSAQALQEAKLKDARLKKSLMDFVGGGRGLVVIHAGVASFREWPEFGVIMGARFENHPWNAGSTVQLKVEEPDHPLCRAFGGDRFQVTDEIYQFKEPYSRDQLRVLLSIDTMLTDMNKGQAIVRTDGDFALGWVKHYGQGRVFYCALGHQHDIFWNPTVLRHYLDGVQFAIGDLPAPAEPRP